uniref:Uncharacterized protein n=1 Tax=Setaria digitata TaxID=48799 RepID=A0A915PL87_9BILA
MRTRKEVFEPPLRIHLHPIGGATGTITERYINGSASSAIGASSSPPLPPTMMDHRVGGQCPRRSGR